MVAVMQAFRIGDIHHSCQSSFPLSLKHWCSARTRFLSSGYRMGAFHTQWHALLHHRPLTKTIVQTRDQDRPSTDSVNQVHSKASTVCSIDSSRSANRSAH
jgi:hypothetical protein